VGELPVAEAAAAEILSLPLQPELDDATARAVAAAVRECAAELS
jgi:dTDP-4-amino-4,6-dideoxygalactose transaminase